MKLKFVTCSGANEYTSIKEMLKLSWDYPQIEFGIQVCGAKGGAGSSRRDWLIKLMRTVSRFDDDMLPNLALHINKDWVESCGAGICPEDLTFLLMAYNYRYNKIFKRVQLNFKIGRDKWPDMQSLEKIMNSYSQEFILSYNESNADYINEMKNRGKARFVCLYDDSHGEGIIPEKRKSPAFDDVEQGYAGGLSPDNVVQELEKINLVVPEKTSIWIDAEGKLKGEDGHLSIDKCREFVDKALTWESHS
ncbi:MAG: hypothetical protein ILA52_01050 [Alphaproteobacteria bacterium]|nr:hypothetical protein [Alphaproteobacteria bacterium]